MTVLTALRHPTKGVIIGSDRRTSDGHSYADRANKWVIRGGWAVGNAGFLRVNNLIDFHGDTLFSDLTSPVEFTFRLAKMFSENNIKFIDDDDSSVVDFGQHMLLVNTHSVWEIDGTLSVLESAENELIAGGSGSQFALGADYALRNHKDPIYRTRMAIEAAIAHDHRCGGEPWIAQFKKEKRS